MSYGRMVDKEAKLKREIQELLERAQQESALICNAHNRLKLPQQGAPPGGNPAALHCRRWVWWLAWIIHDVVLVTSSAVHRVLRCQVGLARGGTVEVRGDRPPQPSE